MTPEALQAAAIRNRANRLGQIDRLKPLRGVARAKIEHLRAAQAGAKTAQESLDLMRTLSHVPNFFPTPPAVLRELLAYALLSDGHLVLEPSAGKGDIAQALSIGVKVKCYEINWTLAEHCRKLGLDCTQGDFLDVTPEPIYDRVVMNPPFERGIDERHVRHAFEFLSPRGRLVSVVCSTTAAKLESWADDVVKLPENAFKVAERSTGVRTALVIKDR